MNLPPGLSMYRLASKALSPLAQTWLEARARAGKEDAGRLPERFGVASTARPEAVLVWLHAASVGETKVALQVREGLSARRPDLFFLITTGTRTAANLIAQTAPPRTHHQYAPLDRPDVAARFFAHWRPDLGVFTESDLWPNLLLEAQAQRVPMALINARLSPKSQANWRRTPESARAVLSSFSVMLAAEVSTAETLSGLSGKTAQLVGNLKLAAAPLIVESHSHAALISALGSRPVWLAASTHQGEDALVLQTHARIRQGAPDALLIIAPRHPDRGDEIAAMADDAFGGAARLRSTGALPGSDDCVYVADTIGELGVLFAVAPVTFMGGSLLAHLKGHNPIEPVLSGSAPLSGPFVESFTDIYADLISDNGVRIVSGVDDLAMALAHLLGDASARVEMVARARACVAQGQPAREITLDALQALLPEAPHAST